ncbi:MAG: hypothetical protein HXX81_07795 [Campylobacterales bacterium]|nr:hypothetical protein [Campylobacterales bacterium]
MTNPTLITKSSEIIKIVDNKNHEVRAFILPVSYAPLIEKLEKERAYKEWVLMKKIELKKSKTNMSKFNDIEDLSEVGFDSINEYLKD